MHYERMRHKEFNKSADSATEASVRKEMAKPRMARSVRITESSTMHGTVDKIIPSPRPSLPEKAQIVVDGADRHRDLGACLKIDFLKDRFFARSAHIALSGIVRVR
jgi:hypothetical protein